MIGGVLVGSAASFAGEGYFMSSLFYTFRTPEGKLSELEKDEPENRHLAAQITRSGVQKGDTFPQKQLEALKHGIRLDFDRQQKIQAPSLPQLFYYKCCNRLRYRVYLKQHSQAIDKIERDFDYLRII